MTIKRWFVAWTIPVIQSGVPAVEVVRATDYDAAQARIAALEAALFDLVGDEVPIVWAAQHYDIAREIALKRTTLETEPKPVPVQFGCQCYGMECRKGTLASNEYCTRDRKRAGLAPSDGGVK